MVLGYAIAAVIGITLGMIIAMSSWGRNTIEPIINALYAAAPMSTLIPVVGIYIGLGFQRSCVSRGRFGPFSSLL